MKTVKFKCYTCEEKVNVDFEPLVEERYPLTAMAESFIEYSIWVDQWKRKHKNHNTIITTDFENIKIYKPIKLELTDFGKVSSELLMED